MKLYSIGDSHADHSFRNVIKEEAERVSIGPVTMNKVRRDKIDFLELYKEHRDVEKFGYKKEFEKDSCAIFCFGEIDVRCHIHNQIQSQNKRENDVIKELVLEFVNHIENQKNIFKEVAILSVTPPGSILWASQNNNFPFIGSDFDRSRYTIKMNNFLKKYCEEKDVSFIDVYKSYSDNKGMLIRELSDGGVHIGNTVHVENKIKNIYNDINITSSI